MVQKWDKYLALLATGYQLSAEAVSDDFADVAVRSFKRLYRTRAEHRAFL